MGLWRGARVPAGCQNEQDEEKVKAEVVGGFCPVYFGNIDMTDSDNIMNRSL
jgi:hypothetical protein